MRRLIFYALLLSFVAVTAKAEVDTLAWKRLVITEVHAAGGAQNSLNNWLEITNMSDQTMDLADYWLQTDWTNLDNAKPVGDILKLNLEGTLEPGESYILMNAPTNDAVDAWGEPRFPDNFYNAEIKAMADVVVNSGEQSLGVAGSGVITTLTVGVFFRGDTSSVDTIVARDSVMVDRFLGSSSDGGAVHPRQRPIAGVTYNHAPIDGHWIRKTLYKVGNDDFNASAGTNADDSEWISLPRQDGQFWHPFTTIGSHVNQTDLVVVPKRAGITVDAANKVIKLPYGIRRDSISREFTWGPNHAWDLRIGADTSQWYVQDGDSIDIYLLGDAGIKHKFVFDVDDITPDFSLIRPLTYQPYWNVETWVTTYTISEGLAMDTIGNINYSEPVDSFFKYMVLEEGAVAEIMWQDDVVRPEILPGNTLKVTRGGSSKEYKLSVNRFAPNHDADLRSIYLPGVDIFTSPATYELVDTIFPFDAGKKFYVVDLPEGTATPPAIIAQPSNSRARVVITRPKSLEGGDMDRTALIDVYAEDDTTINQYKILFNVERETPAVQGEPFFSDVAHLWANSAQNIQVFNPNDDELFLSDYVIMRYPRAGDEFGTWVDYTNQGGSSMMGDRTGDKPLKRVNKYITRPGFMIKTDDNNDAYYEPSPVFTKDILESREVYSIVSALHGYPIQGGWWDHLDHVAEIDLAMSQRDPTSLTWHYKPWMYATGQVELGADIANMDSWTVDKQYPYGEGEEYNFWLFANEEWDRGVQGDSYSIWKIVNDSVLDNTKPLNKNFEEDYELVDMVHGISLKGIQWKVYGKDWVGNDTVFDCSKAGTGYRDICLARLPHIYTGNPVDAGSFGSEGNAGEWDVYGIAADGSGAKKTIDGVTKGGNEYGQSRFNNHTMLTYAHVPYLTSSKYIIAKGLDGEQPILGVVAGTDVNGFFSNIDIADTAMSVMVYTASDVMKQANDVIVTGDKVVSIAANKASQVTYVITVGDLDNSTTLTAKAGASVSVDGLTVKGIATGTTLKELKEMLEAPESATVVVTDGKEKIIAMELWPADTIMVEERIKVDVLASPKYVIEVTAQNGTDRAKYALEFTAEDALYALSDVYSVNEEEKSFDFVWGTNVSNFLNNVVPSAGASLMVVNKLGQERPFGSLRYHDRLVVYKGDTKVEYYLKFFNEEDGVIDAVEQVELAVSNDIYPNPTADGMVTISNLNNAYQISVRNIAGQLIDMYNVNSLQKTINLKGANGVYLISVYNNDGSVTTSKVAKQ